MIKSTQIGNVNTDNMQSTALLADSDYIKVTSPMQHR